MKYMIKAGTKLIRVDTTKTKKKNEYFISTANWVFNDTDILWTSDRRYGISVGSTDYFVKAYKDVCEEVID